MASRDAGGMCERGGGTRGPRMFLVHDASLVLYLLILHSVASGVLCCDLTCVFLSFVYNFLCDVDNDMMLRPIFSKMLSSHG